MGALQLAWVDIRRTRSRTNIFIGIQSLTTACGMLFNRLALSLAGQVSYYTGFNTSILTILHEFLSYLGMTALITGILVATLLSSILTIARMRDLAVLLAMGGSFKEIQRVPLAQMFLLTLISGILGWIINLMFQVLFQILFGVPLITLEGLLFPVSETIYVFMQLLGVYFVAGFIINYLIRRKFREIIEGQYTSELRSTTKVWGSSVTKHVEFWLGYLFSKRFRVLSLLMLVGTSMLVFLISFSVFGGNIIQTTTISYIKRGYGTNIIVVTPTEISSLVAGLYDPSNQSKPFQSTLLSKNLLIPLPFLQALPNSSKFESRLLLGGEIDVLLPLEISEYGSYPTSGKITGESFYWGIEEGTFPLFNYFNIGDDPVSTNNIVHIGDGLLDGTVPSAQSVSLRNVEQSNRFNIGGLILDPFARGDCIYMDIGELVALRGFPSDSRNVVFIQNPSQQVLTMIQQNPSLGSFFLDIHKDRYVTMTDPFWISSFSASLPLVVSIALAIIAYSSLVVRSILVTDLRTLYTLGGGSPILFRVICWVNIWNLKMVPISVILGLSSAHMFLIVEPLLPTFEPFIGLGIAFSAIILISFSYFKKISTTLVQEFVR